MSFCYSCYLGIISCISLPLKYFFLWSLSKAPSSQQEQTGLAVRSPQLLSSLSSPHGISQIPVYWSKNLDTRVKLLGGDCYCYSRSGSDTATVYWGRIQIPPYRLLLCDLTLCFFTFPFLSVLLQTFLDSTQSTREHEGRGRLSDWNSWLSWWHHIPKRGKESQEERLLILNSKQLHAREESTALLTVRKRQQRDFKYISHSLMDHAWSFCGKTKLRGNHASKPSIVLTGAEKTS